jgi:hypothetical protein
MQRFWNWIREWSSLPRVTGRRPRSFRPELQLLEGRKLPSATTSCYVQGYTLEEFVVTGNQQLFEKKQDAQGNWGALTPVPGTVGWPAWDVKAVRDAHDDVEVFVNGKQDGHLWEVTERSASNGGGWSGWTNMNRVFKAFDVDTGSDGINIFVAGIDANTRQLDQITEVFTYTNDAYHGSWGTYWNFGSFPFQDVAIAGGFRTDYQIVAVGASDHHVWVYDHEPNVNPQDTWRNLGGTFDGVKVQKFTDINAKYQLIVSAYSNLQGPLQIQYAGETWAENGQHGTFTAFVNTYSELGL